MSIFNTKEEYLNFITAWKNAVKHENNKPKRIVCDHYQGTRNWFDEKTKRELAAKGYTNVSGYGYTIPNGGHCKTPAWITGSHFVLRNILLGKPAMHGFTQKGKKKLNQYENPWIAFEQCLGNLGYLIKRANNDENDERVKKFLEPFCGVITVEQFAKIVIDYTEIEDIKKVA